MGRKITIENAVLTAIIDGVSYNFDFVTNITLTDPQENTMTVSPQGHGHGVVFRTGTTSPVTNDFVIRDVSQPLYAALISAYREQKRVDFLLYDKNGGDQYECNQSIIRTNPSNATVAEGEESLNVPLNTSCAPNDWKHTPPADA